MNGVIMPHSERELMLESKGNSDLAITKNQFSFFKKPVINTLPYTTITLLDAYKTIKGNYFAAETAALRLLQDKKEARLFKALNFHYVTFSGTFLKRHSSALIQHSELMVIDFDHLENVNRTKDLLLSDNELETQLLFTSPSGDGLKWVIKIDLAVATHEQFFIGIRNYLDKKYQLPIDNSGKDVARACFLPHDENVFINPKHLSHDF